MSSLTPEAFGRPPAVVKQDLELERDKYQQERAVWLATSNIIPKHFRGQPQAVYMACQFGEMVGLKPFQALQIVTYVEGHLTIKADAQRALLADRGWDIAIREFQDADTLGCVHKRIPEGHFRLGAGVTLTSPQGKKFDEVAVTYAELFKAGATKIDDYTPWIKYADDMLVAAASRKAIRRHAPNVLLGISYTTEELVEATEYETQEPAEEPKAEEPVEEAVLVEEEEPENEPECEPMNAEQLQKHLDENAPKQEPAEVAKASFDLKAQLKINKITQAEFARKAHDLELVDRMTSVTEIAEMKDVETIFKMTLSALEEDRNG